MSAPRAPNPGDSSTPPSSSKEYAAAAYPHLSSKLPPLLQLPSDALPCFTSLGANIPLPCQCQLKQASRFKKGSTPRAVAEGQTPSWTATSGNDARSHSAAGRRPTPPRPSPTSAAPAVSFCNSALLNFHTLVVPATRNTKLSEDAVFWIRPALDSHLLLSVRSRTC